MTPPTIPAHSAPHEAVPGDGTVPADAPYGIVLPPILLPT